MICVLMFVAPFMVLDVWLMAEELWQRFEYYYYYGLLSDTNKSDSIYM